MKLLPGAKVLRGHLGEVNRDDLIPMRFPDRVRQQVRVPTEVAP